MSTSAVTARLAQVEDVASLVLKAERSALAEVEQYRHQTQDSVAGSSLRAEQLHQRTEERIMRLRERMTIAAEDRLAQISSEMAALASDMGTDEFKLALLDNAIARVTEELVGISESS